MNIYVGNLSYIFALRQLERDKLIVVKYRRGAFVS